MAGLTRENVASHLQKHRMRLKKEEDAAGGPAGDHAPCASGRAGGAADGADADEAEHAGGQHGGHKRHGHGGEGGGGGDARRPQRQRRAAAAAALVPAPSEVSGALAGRDGVGAWCAQLACVAGALSNHGRRRLPDGCPLPASALPTPQTGGQQRAGCDAPAVAAAAARQHPRCARRRLSQRPAAGRPA